MGALGLGLPLQSHSLQQTILVVQHHISASGKLETVVLFSSGFLGQKNLTLSFCSLSMEAILQTAYCI